MMSLMELVNKVLEGNVVAAARLMRCIEDGAPNVGEALKSIYSYTGRAYTIGVTGAPGAGKSSLIDCMIAIFRREGMTVGVLAVDPTSPFTGGAILGDRIRMQRHAADRDVFVRSLATRGCSGGLSKSTLSLVHVMDAMGKDIILVETVGIGQVEVDISKIADTSILVLMPGMGDAIQMMKAGILEAADIFAINKADRAGTDSIKLDLEAMLEMEASRPDEWKPPIITTEAIHGRGAEELTKAIFQHRQFLVSSGELTRRRQSRARLELGETVESYLKHYIDTKIDNTYLAKVVDDLVEKRTDPYSAAANVIKRSLK